jgi:hypothetical protein
MQKGGELIPDYVSENDVRDEANKRAARAGYCSRSGEPLGRTKVMVTANFGERRLNIWPRDKNGNLIGD